LTELIRILLRAQHDLRATTVNGGWVSVDTPADLVHVEKLVSRLALDASTRGTQRRDRTDPDYGARSSI